MPRTFLDRKRLTYDLIAADAIDEHQKSECRIRSAGVDMAKTSVVERAA